MYDSGQRFHFLIFMEIQNVIPEPFFGSGLPNLFNREMLYFCQNRCVRLIEQRRTLLVFCVIQLSKSHRLCNTENVNKQYTIKQIFIYKNLKRRKGHVVSKIR